MSRIESIEYFRCMLEPSDDIASITAPVRTWTADMIPALFKGDETAQRFHSFTMKPGVFDET